MGLIATLKSYVIKLSHEAIWFVSELEASFSKPNSNLFFRRLYLCINGIKPGKHLWIGRGFRLLDSKKLVLGERCALGDFVKLSNHAPIVLGDDFIGATGLHIDSGTHDPITLEPKNLPVCIGNRVWCGINVTIIAGVTIGDDVVIGAGSVVCKDIPSNSVAVGVPARVIKHLNRDSDTKLWSWIRD